MKIRSVTARDAAQLLEIYAPYVQNTAITFEYIVPSEQEFAQRIADTLAKYPYFAAEQDGEILGYAYANAFKGRAAYDWSVETTVYVKQSSRHSGVGAALYAALAEKLREQGIQNMYACIAYPETEDEYLTQDSVRFHEHLGFHIVGQFHKCANKFDRWYDMVWMEKSIGSHEQPPTAVHWRETIG